MLGAGPPPECAGAGTDTFRPARLGSERPARVEGRGFRLDPSMWLGPNHRHTRQTPHSSALPACPLLQVLGTQPGLALSLSGTPQWLPDPPAVSSKEALSSPAGGRDWGALNRAPSAACLPNPTLSEPSPRGKWAGLSLDSSPAQGATLCQAWALGRPPGASVCIAELNFPAANQPQPRTQGRPGWRTETPV